MGSPISGMLQNALNQQEFERQRMAQHQANVDAEAQGGPPAGLPPANPYQDMSGAAPPPPAIGVGDVLMAYLRSLGGSQPQPQASPVPAAGAPDVFSAQQAGDDAMERARKLREATGVQ